MNTIKKCLLLLLLSTLSSWTQSNCLDPMQAGFLLEIVDKLKRGENVIFTKYGDGEYNCMKGDRGHNVDHDTYHPWLGAALQRALVSLCKKPNTYIGKWWTADASNFCDSVAAQNKVRVPWSWYHLFMNDDNFLEHHYMHEFVSFVIKTDRKKIIICNSNNRKMKELFRADVLIEIPSNSWSFEYTKWENIVAKHAEKDSIIMIAGGLCSKVLIDNITNMYDLTFIDIGSSFDLMSTGLKSRPWKHSREDELTYYKDLLPHNW